MPVSDSCVLRVLEGLMTLRSRGGARERLSYRTLDVEQIGSVYETVMGFTVLPASGPALAVRGGKNNRTPVFLDLAEVAGLKGEERLKRIKEAGRASLTVAQSKAVKSASTVADLAVALDGIVDERASPGRTIQATGTPILQPTDERRRTGSHYTPRSLTEPIVRHALEPAFDRLGEAATPEQILGLKVCDPAMGSGAFLVEACRQLGARLVRAWAQHQATPTLPADEDADLHARRLVAQHCLYGVDRNPRAVDLAKLSLWLATLAADHEFTFLDHALREGDSLVGLTRAQIAALHWDESKPPTLVGHLVADHLREAEAERAAIRAAAEGASETELHPRLRRAEANLAVARLIGDGVIAAHFVSDKPKKRVEAIVTLQRAVQSHLGSATWHEALAPLAASLKDTSHPVLPFHWPVEFPEVFSRKNPGFDVLVGNPPFLGGKNISGSYSTSYLNWLHQAYEKTDGQVDIAAFFFRAGFALIRSGGCIGFIATKTISQGDTRRAGLAFLCSSGGALLDVQKRVPWPGEAAVIVSIIVMGKDIERTNAILDGNTVAKISPYLVPGTLATDPMRLSANGGIAFMGYYNYGQGFIFDDNNVSSESIENMRMLIESNPDNAERIHPIIGGEELLESSVTTIRRYVIDFEDMSLEEAKKWPDLLDILERRVRPEREKANRERLRKIWWQFGEVRPGLREASKGLSRILTHPYNSKHLSFSFIPANVYVASPHYAIVRDSYWMFCCLQSRLHELWTRFFASSLEDRLRYAASDCFETFPLPLMRDTTIGLEAVGKAYYEHRAATMASRDEGMTKIYNRFHSPSERSDDIKKLRDLHVAMDCAMLAAYGWEDLVVRATPEWLDTENEPEHTYQGRLFWSSAFRDEVLGRLLALNAERAAAERAAGLVAAPVDDEEAAA
jgi:hypothetical protein